MRDQKTAGDGLELRILAEISFELGKGKKRIKQVEELLCSERSAFSGIDIPESPLGKLSINSIVIGSLVKRSCPQLVVFSHIRLADASQTLFLSLLSAADLADIDAVFLTYGEKEDRERGNRFSAEDAFVLASRYDLHRKAGAILSLRYEYDFILKRLEFGFRKFLVLRLSNETIEKFRGIAQKAEEIGAELYPYIILKTQKNKDILEKMGQPAFETSELIAILKELEDSASGVVLSTAGDLKSLITIQELLNKKL